MTSILEEERSLESPSPGSPPSSFRAGAKAAFPVVLGYLAIGFTFGVVGRSVGMTLLEIGAMSVLLYAGSAQFIAAGMIGASNPVSAIAGTVFLVNLRHMLYSASLAPQFRGQAWSTNLLIGAQLTDETFAVASSHVQRHPEPPRRWMFGLNFSAQVTWVTASVLGGLFGQLVANTTALGLDFALAAMFMALLVLQLFANSQRARAVAIAFFSGALAIALAVTVGGSWTVLVVTVIAASVGAWMDRP